MRRSAIRRAEIALSVFLIKMGIPGNQENDTSRRIKVKSLHKAPCLLFQFFRTACLRTISLTLPCRWSVPDELQLVRGQQRPVPLAGCVLAVGDLQRLRLAAELRGEVAQAVVIDHGNDEARVRVLARHF